jgi:hypothetical protein
MTKSDVPAVHLERRPHRDAVVQLREAYRRLWLASQQPSAEAVQIEVVVKTAITVQEVSS